MTYLRYALLSYVYLTFFGIGVTYFILPLRLRAYALIFCPLVGFAVSTLLLWRAYAADLPGTDSYGWYLLLCPAVVNGFALRHASRRKTGAFAWLTADGALALIPAAFTIALLSIPFATYSGGPTTMALGNNDIADYACMARFLKEFARSSKLGFLGQFGGFRRLCDEGWFGPAAITSLLSSTLHAQCFQLQSMCVNLFCALGTSFAYAFSREYFQMRRWYAAVVSSLYAIHPIIARVAWDGFYGQIMATSLILALLLVGLVGIQEESWRAKFSYLPLLVTLSWGIMVSYSFMLIFGFWILAATPLFGTISTGRFRALTQGFALLASTVLLTFALSPFRVLMLYRQFAFVKIQAGYYFGFLYPDRVMGMLGRDLFLTDRARPLFAIVITGAIVFILGLGVRAAWRSGQRHSVYFLLPLLVIYSFSGYLYFTAAAAELPFASYKAFKPIAVFLPVFYCLFWLAAWHLSSTISRLQLPMLGLLLGLDFAAEAFTTNLILQRMQATEAVVTPEMADLAVIEGDPTVSSLNVYSSQPWPYLWHTYFLMKKPLFLSNTWYGRPKSLPSGAFNLVETGESETVATRVRLLSTGVPRPINRRYQIAKFAQHTRLPLVLGEGWWPKEPTHCWTGATGNKYRVYVKVDGSDGWGQLHGLLLVPLSANDKITLAVNGVPVPVEQTSTELEAPEFPLRRGQNVLEFSHTARPIPPSAADPRSLLAAWKELVVDFTRDNDDSDREDKSASAGSRLRPTLEFGEGWWPKEQTHSWTGATGNKYRIYATVTGAGGEARVSGHLFVPLRAGDKIGLTVNGRAVTVDQTARDLRTSAFRLRHGRNILEFTHSDPPIPPSAADPRSLLAAWQQIVVDFVGEPNEPK